MLSRTAAIIPPMKLTLEIMVPLMRRVGEAWHEGRLKISHEHIISGQLRSLLGTLMRQVESPVGAPRVIVTTPPGHRHEFGAIIGAFMAASRGFEPIYLGANTPFDNISDAAAQSDSALILLSVARECNTRERESLRAGLEALARNHEVWVGISDRNESFIANARVTLFRQYDELDRALFAYRSR
jgi:methanogenic corrinoid protein MtbC1